MIRIPAVQVSDTTEAKSGLYSRPTKYHHSNNEYQIPVRNKLLTPAIKLSDTYINL